MICVRNARCWGITAQSRAALMKSHTEQHTMHVLLLYICHVKFVLHVVELRELVLYIVILLSTIVEYVDSSNVISVRAYFVLLKLNM